MIFSVNLKNSISNFINTLNKLTSDKENNRKPNTALIEARINELVENIIIEAINKSKQTKI